MAVFQHTEPREDTVTRRALTADDIAFLCSLQKELNTQDTMGNRDPRFWVIRETQTRPTAIEDADELRLTDTDGNEIRSFEDVVEYVEAHYSPTEYLVEIDGSGRLLLYYYDIGDKRYLQAHWDSFEEFSRDVDTTEPPFDGVEVRGYEQYRDTVPDTLFLTHRECEDHLRKYGYNYAPDAHAYAMTADRSPQFERLINLLQSVDWTALNLDKTNK